MKYNRTIRYLMIPMTALFFAACSTAPKDQLSSSADPAEEIGKLITDLNIAQENNVDVLARKDYLKAQKYLDRAKSDLAKGKDQEDVIDELRYGKEALQKAYSTAGTRKEKASALFAARQSAMQSGASRSTKLRDDWQDIDEDIADVAHKLDKVSAEDLEMYQMRYVDLERKAVIENQLGRATAQVSGARSDGAEKIAPAALRKADMSLKNAESLISTNVTNPPGFEQAVVQATNDADLLSDVMEVQKQNGKKLSESAATKMVMQGRTISGLKKNLNTSRSETSNAERQVIAGNRKLDQKDRDLDKAQSSVAIQTAMEESRQQFNSNEAEVYQQGGNLVIRLKTMNFRTGRADLPEQSLKTLSKVSEVAKNLNAKEIKVEGHTDSIGTSEINQKLSEQRASAVAAYFKSNGFDGAEVSSEGLGYDHPIATNKSKSVRALNRRVDVIITPVESNSISQ